jgi:hypothetical protein
MPALVKALTGVLPDGAVRQLMQALGNCNQPYTSRGVQNFQAPEQIGNNNGVYSGGPWNPSQYPGLIPPAGSPGRTDIPGGGGWQGGNYNGGNTNVNNYGGNSFYFPTSQEFALNNYYGGPIMNVGGNSTFNNITANNITTNSVTVVSGGGGGGGGLPALPGEPQPGGPGIPGGGGGAGPGGNFPGPIILPPVWNRPPGFGGGGGGGGASPPFTGTISVSVPTEGELTDACKVVLTTRRRTAYTVTVR